MSSSEIPKLLLDPQTEAQMLSQMYARTQAASGNTLNDFTPGSPVAAIHEGQAYAIAELLWFLNKLPEATALEVLRLSGVTRSAGTFSTGTLAVLLRSPLATAFSLPAGYAIAFRDRNYLLLEDLYVPAGAIEGRVTVRAAKTGATYNAPAFGLSTTTAGLNYVQSIYNPEPVTGGSDLEPLENTIRRAQVALRSRDVLVSAGDYEGKAQEILGSGSKAWALPLLGSNRETKAAGNVHVFLLGADGVPPATGTCQDVQGTLGDLSFAGASVWVSPVVLEEIDMDLTLGVSQLSQGLAQAVYDSLQAYLDPFSFPLGGTLKIKELEYTARGVAEVSEVVSMLIQGQAINRPVGLPYAFPRLGTVAISMTDPIGQHKTYYLGTTQGDPL